MASHEKYDDNDVLSNQNSLTTSLSVLENKIVNHI